MITFVADRPGLDRRYAIDPSKAEAGGRWRADQGVRAALEETVRWYLDNEAWWRPIREAAIPRAASASALPQERLIRTS